MTERWSRRPRCSPEPAPAPAPSSSRARIAGDGRRLSALVLDRFGRIVAGEVLLGLGVLAAVPFLAGSARGEVGHEKVGALTASGLGLGILLVGTVAGAFMAIARASDGLSSTPAVAAR